MDDRKLKQEIRQVRKRFQQYAYQLKITHAIEDITIPAVVRVDKPETIYPSYQTDIRSVYAGRSTRIYDDNNNNNNSYRRSIIYSDGVILPS